MKDPREKARDLIELATKDGGNEKERLVAAVKAVELIKKHDLLENPMDGIFAKAVGNIDDETIQAAGTLFALARDPKVTGAVRSLFKKRRR